MQSTSSSQSFKKKKTVAGQKRTRLDPLVLADNDEEDIVAALEFNARDQGLTGHLATKKARQEAMTAQAEKQNASDDRKRANF